MQGLGDDVTWLAQKYVLGAMTATEAADFEMQLGDEAAAVAVADAVWLLAALEQTTPAAGIDSAVVRPRETSSLGGRWVQFTVAAMAVCVALAIVPALNAVQRGHRPVEPAELVSRWQGLELGETIRPSMVADIEPPVVERLPRWLVAAVALAGESIVAEESN